MSARNSLNLMSMSATVTQCSGAWMSMTALGGAAANPDANCDKTVD